MLGAGKGWAGFVPAAVRKPPSQAGPRCMHTGPHGGVGCIQPGAKNTCVQTLLLAVSSGFAMVMEQTQCVREPRIAGQIRRSLMPNICLEMQLLIDSSVDDFLLMTSSIHQ